jgi:hypothetical protein
LPEEFVRKQGLKGLVLHGWICRVFRLCGQMPGSRQVQCIPERERIDPVELGWRVDSTGIAGKKANGWRE